MDNIRTKEECTTQRKSMISVRNGFSDKAGIGSCNTAMQFQELDNRTRTILCNDLFKILTAIFDHVSIYGDNTIVLHLCQDMEAQVFNRFNILDGNLWPGFNNYYSNNIADVITNAIYNEVFDIIEYIGHWVDHHFYGQEYCGQVSSVINAVFLSEYVGYRFVNNTIVPITDNVELETIQTASGSQLDGCRIHINKAIDFLSDRTNPDYKNSIKESISAVESICATIAAKPKATLGDALKILESQRGLKGHLKSAFEKLYAYTNEKGGIRHAEGSVESEVSFDEAKFMLVSCCAFVNYLTTEYGKLGEE